MGSYTFRWYVISAPLLSFEKGKDVSSAMEPRRASELAFSRPWWSCRLAKPKAGYLVAQCYLRYRQPTHAQIFTPIHHHRQTLLTPHNPPADCCFLHIGIILPKKYT